MTDLELAREFFHWAKVRVQEEIKRLKEETEIEVPQDALKLQGTVNKLEEVTSKTEAIEDCLEKMEKEG